MIKVAHSQWARKEAVICPLFMAGSPLSLSLHLCTNGAFFRCPIYRDHMAPELISFPTVTNAIIMMTQCGSAEVLPGEGGPTGDRFDAFVEAWDPTATC